MQILVVLYCIVVITYLILESLQILFDLPQLKFVYYLKKKHYKFTVH